MLFALSGTQVSLGVSGFPPNLTTVGYAVLDPSVDPASVVITRTLMSESPSGSGTYLASFTAPTPATFSDEQSYLYEIHVDDGESPVQADEIIALVVSQGPPTGVVPTTIAVYASPDDLRAYTNQTVQQLPESTALWALQEAQNDLDHIFERLQYSPTTNTEQTGRILDPTDVSQLTPRQVLKLNRATCAQAEYRLAMGDRFFVRPQRQSSSAGGITVTGKLPYYGPKVRRELIGSGLLPYGAQVVISGRQLGRRVAPSPYPGWPPPAWPWDV